MMRIQTIGLAMGFAAFGAMGACDETTPVAPAPDVDAQIQDTATDVADVADVADTAPDVAPDVVPDTAPDVAPDVAPEVVTPSELVCGDYLDCIVAACAGDMTATCFDTAIAGCTGDALTTDEAAEGKALATCLVDNKCGFDGEKAHFECWQVKCLPETAACAQAATGGDDCQEINGCMTKKKDCMDFFGVFDWACAQPCMDDASSEAVASFWGLELCLRASCDGDLDQETCRQFAKGNSLSCAIEYLDCVGDGL